MREGLVVVGIGELLWDVFPTGKRLGGAPVNFACHCTQLGATGYPVSCVGDDALGAEIIEALEVLGVDPSYVSKTSMHPTGTVQVSLDEHGKPSYEICKGVAWDYIPFCERTETLAQQADAVCFGSLAQRNGVSRKTIPAFLLAMRPDALKIFDINLRQNFHSREIIEESLELCNILKLSDEELPVVAELFGITGSVLDQLNALIRKFDLEVVAYTRGAEGSLLVSPDEANDHPGCPTQAINSVGAGDSFTATLCMGLLNKKTFSEINEHANQVAAFVCSQDGATPVLPSKLTKGK